MAADVQTEHIAQKAKGHRMMETQMKQNPHHNIYQYVLISWHQHFFIIIF